MDTSRISFGEMIAGASGLALFIILFFPWYGVSLEGAGSDFDGPDFSAWESFSFIDILLFLVAVIAVGLVLARAMGAIPSGLPAPPGLIIAAVGVLALLLVLFRLIDVPGEDFSGFGVEAEINRKVGVFLALLASAGIAFGGWTAMNERASGQAPPA